MSAKQLLVFIFAIGLFLRFILIPNPGFEADVSFWKSWGLAVFDKGVVEGIKITNNNYPTPFAYVLGFMIWLYSFFADPHNFNQFWTNTNTLFLFVSKIFPILADFGIAAVFLYVGKNAKTLGFPGSPSRSQGPPGRCLKELLPGVCFSVYEAIAIVYLLSPISLADGAWWGQVDSVGVFIFLGALILLLRKKPFLAGVVYMTAVMTKLQNMIYSPLLFLFAWQVIGFPGLVRLTAGSALAFFGLNIEFFLARRMDMVLLQLTVNYDYFPYLSLNAFNLWWIVARGHGLALLDKITVIGITNAKTLGLYLFSSFYLLVATKQFYKGAVAPSRQNNTHNGAFEETSRRQTLLQTFIEGLIIINASFFLFMTQSHDRYLFPTSVFLLLWSLFFISQEHPATRKIATLLHCYIAKKNFRLPDSLSSKLEARSSLVLFSIFYFLFTILYFYNLHTALVLNYPKNGAPLLSSLTQPVFTIATAGALIVLFCLFLVVISHAAPKGSSFPFSFFRFPLSNLLFPFTFFVLLILSTNHKLITKQPISLTRFSPIISRQDWGRLVVNMPNDAKKEDSRTWKWLSVQYAFYRKGFGTHAGSYHTFDINRKFKRFTVDYGIDTEAGPKGSAVFEIWGDDTLLFRSEKIGRFDLPHHAEVDVSGIKILGLVTTDAGDGNTDDHTDWLNPQLWP